MRMSTDDIRNDELADHTIAAAAAAGMTVFDTARAYGRSADELGDNEALVAGALRRCGADGKARIVTKGGMTRAGGRWIPDGRASAIRRDCEASLAALGGVPIDLYLIHAPDPRTPWRTSVRALARLVDEGLVHRVGLANVTRRHLEEARDIAPIAAVQVALSPYDDSAIRGGVVEYCAPEGIAVMAHSPLGGPRRAGGLAHRHVLVDVANECHATPAEVALAWLLALSPAVVAIPGSRRPETARSAARAARLKLDTDHRAVLTAAFGRHAPSRPQRAHPPAIGDVVLVMGIPGAGKSRIADQYVARGYVRLNRDQRGGSLRDLADALDDQLSQGVGRVVLDNTWLTRAARSHIVDVANTHRVPARCIWIDISLAQAQVNLVTRMLERFGSLPTPDEVLQLARHEPGVLMPTSQMRALRELEPPSTDEGFGGVERLPFERTAPDGPIHRAGWFVAATALRRPGWQRAFEGPDHSAPHMVFDWSPGGTVDSLDACVASLAAEVVGPVESALCPHPAGPPSCWCRPPLPGMPLAFAQAHGVDTSRSVLVGTAPAHRTLAAAIGAQFVSI